MRPSQMAWFVVCSIAIGWNSYGAEADQFPHAAYVAVEDAPVRSGPGPTYYPTAELARGSRVEVYRHDPGGWFAVRPPEGSYSWVRADQVHIDDAAGMGQVIGTAAITRVGTEVGPERDVEFIRLDEGEWVEILGADVWLDEQTGESSQWLKIAPPPGEFRWIHQSSVSLTLAESLTDASASPAHATDDESSEGSILPVVATDQVEQEDRSTGWRVPGSEVAVPETDREPIEVASLAPLERVVPLDRLIADLQTQSEANELRSIDRLESQVNSIVASEPGQWDLIEVRNQLQAHLNQATEPTLRQRTMRLLDRVDQFSLIQRQYALLEMEASRALAPEIPTLEFETPTVERGEVASVQGNDGAPLNYDGIGYLMPAISQHEGAPRYALTDSRGQVLQLVTPAPGLNLHRYLEQQVGIYGQRGYHTQLRHPHLMAERVIQLDRHR